VTPADELGPHDFSLRSLRPREESRQEEQLTKPRIALTATSVPPNREAERSLQPLAATIDVVEQRGQAEFERLLSAERGGEFGGDARHRGYLVATDFGVPCGSSAGIRT
jgi:hypothetical protein